MKLDSISCYAEHSHAVNITLSKHLDTSKYIPITGSLNSKRMLPRRWQLDKPSSTVPDRGFPLLAFIDSRKDAGNGAQVLGIDHESSVDPWEANMDHYEVSGTRVALTQFLLRDGSPQIDKYRSK